MEHKITPQCMFYLNRKGYVSISVKLVKVFDIEFVLATFTTASGILSNVRPAKTKINFLYT